MDTPLADKMRWIIAAHFAALPERRAEQIKAAREKLTKEWPQVDPLKVGEFSALSPYSFLQRAHYDWHPTAEQMAEARKLLRPLNEDTFVEQMKDTREPIVFTYVRRPRYYAAFASAPKTITKQQRLGLTFVWTPLNGALLQSQTNGTETAWGTFLGADVPVEGTGFDAVYSADNTQVRYSPRVADPSRSPSRTIAFASPLSATAKLSSGSQSLTPELYSLRRSTQCIQRRLRTVPFQARPCRSSSYAPRASSAARSGQKLEEPWPISIRVT